MRIAVLVKQVPDSYGVKAMLPSGRLDRESVAPVMNEYDENAVEAALQVREAVGGEVVVVCMGPASARDAIRRALAMGADTAIHVCDDSLESADLGVTASVLAAVVARDSFDLVICGAKSTDAGGGVVPVMLSSLLGWPALTRLRSMSVGAGKIVGVRMDEVNEYELAAALPAVVSVNELANTPRMPNMKGVMAARNKPVDELSAAALGLGAASLTVVDSVSARPPRSGGVVVRSDEPNAISGLVALLRERGLL